MLCDLSPAATFIASTYLEPPSPEEFDWASQQLLDSVEEETGDLWSLESDGASNRVEFTVWAEVFRCPHCQERVVTEQVIRATESIGSAKEFECPHCHGLVSKAPTKESRSARLERFLGTKFDAILGVSIRELERVPLAVQVTNARDGRRIVPVTDEYRKWLESLDDSSEYWYPTDPLIEGERYRLKDCLPSYGVTHIHHLYLPRQLKTLSRLWHHATLPKEARLRRALQFFVSSNALGLTVLNRYAPTHYSQVNKYFSGTLYVPSIVAETSPAYVYRNKRKRLVKAFGELQGSRSAGRLISTQSATDLGSVPSESIDYVFIDPPFGRNLQYSELNQVWESWLRVKTDRSPEAVMDKTRDRGVLEYGHLMRVAFSELWRVLKSGRWMTVVFHNSSNAVWMAIQEGLVAAGFVVADVRTLDKARQSYKQIREGTVKQDLVISAYKPPVEVQQEFSLHPGTPDALWAFVRSHLKQLPVVVLSGEALEVVAERQDYLLFDRMVAFHVQRGVPVPLSAAEFYAGLEQRFPCRDRMYFLSEQVSAYDRKRLQSQEFRQLELFVKDEESAIHWLRYVLSDKPRTLQDLVPVFMKETAGWEKHEKPLELAELLKENFISFDGSGEVPSQIHAYLSSNFREMRGLGGNDPALRAKAKDRWYVPDPRKAGDLEQLRERTLLKEFDDYAAGKGKLKLFRLEAVRAGFKRSWQEHDYKTIISFAERLPADVLQEDAKLLMWYDQALTRAGE